VLAKLFEGRGEDDDIRIWVPACSTGEEAYSLGMLALAELDRHDAKANVTIFGTDIDEDALHVARIANYSNKAAEQIPAEHLERYMVPTTDGYAVGKRLRGLVRFSQQSVIKDPPFSKLDLISCRNLLIYFEKQLQRHVMNIFHYGLKPDGLLILGTSESINGLSNGFVEVNKTGHIYRRNSGPSQPLNLPSGLFSPASPSRPSADQDASNQDLHKDQALKDAILERHTPPYIITDSDGTITQLSASAERYLRVRGGAMNTQIGSLIHPALETVVRRLNNQSVNGQGKISSAEFDGEIDGEKASLEIRSEYLQGGQRVFVFNATTANLPASDRHLQNSTGEESDYLRELEQELDEARHTLRTTIEELETSNEELKSSNEEMMSMNEELQSANEELSTTNDELQSRLAEVHELNADLNDFISSTSLGTVFLDNEMRLRRFTPTAEQHFKFVDTDLGRNLAHIASSLPVDTILKLCRETLASGEVTEDEITSTDGSREFIIRIVSSLDQDDEARGVVFTLIDVTELRTYARDLEASEARARESLAEVEELYRVSPAAMALMAPDTTYLRVNQRLAEINGVPIKDHYGKKPRDIVPDLGDSVIDPVRQVFETGEPILDREVVGYTSARPDEERAWIVDWYPLKNGDDVIAVGVNVRDITHYTEMQDDLRRVMRELQHRVKNMLGNVTALVNRARKDPRDRDVVLETLFDRLIALGNTHQLLAADNWRKTSFLTLIKSELTDVYGEDKVSLRGPEIMVTPRATLALGMALHEMATNAAKYGALSAETGMIDVRWSRLDEGDGEILRLVWSEKDGPKVTSPENNGFGSTLISSTIKDTLEGQIHIDWEPKGVSYVFQIPFENIIQYDSSVDAHSF